MVGRDGAMTGKIPVFEETYDEAVAKKKVVDVYYPISRVIGIAETQEKALERILERENLKADAIFEVRYSNQSNKHGWIKRCEGIAYKKNSSSSAA